MIENSNLATTLQASAEIEAQLLAWDLITIPEPSGLR
jgi:hypothetical protein